MKIKIVYLIHDLGRGGAEKQLVELVSSLPFSLYEIHVITILKGGDYEGELKKIGVPVYNLDLKNVMSLPRIFFKLFFLLKR